MTFLSGCASSVSTIMKPKTILSLNLCQDMKEPRDSRFTKLADYIANNNVDMVLYQEGSGGLVDGCINSVSLLCRKLKDRHKLYHYVDVNSFGAICFMVFKTGILTNSKFDWFESCSVGKPSGGIIDVFPLPNRKNVVAIGIGDTMYVSVHFFSGDDKTTQTTNLLTFISRLERKHPSQKVIVGGDFNMGSNSKGYKIIIDNGFHALAGAGIDFIFGKGVAGTGHIAIPTGVVSDHPAIEVQIKE